MDDLISRSAEIEELKDWRGDKEDLDRDDPYDVGYYAAMGRAIRIAERAPTIDAVPVVRCKDCVVSQRCIDDNYVWCSEWHKEMEKDGFCHHGIRMNAE